MTECVTVELTSIEIGFSYFNFALVNVVTLAGLVGNSLSLAVFYSQKRQTSTIFFLKSLAVFDSILLLLIYAVSQRYAYRLLADDPSSLSSAATLMSVILKPFGYIVQTCSTYCMVCLTVDRYIHACRPLTARHWCTVFRARVQVAIVIMVSLLYNIPRFIEFYPLLTEEKLECSGINSFTVPSPERSPVYIYLYAFGCYLLLMFVVPMILLTILNTRLYRVIRQQRLQTSNKHLDRVSLSVIIVTTIFIISQIPDVIHQVLYRLGAETLDEAEKFSIITYDFLTVNSAINFVVYARVGSKFRNKLKVMMGCKCQKRVIQQN